MTQYVTKESLQEARHNVQREDVVTRNGVFPCAGMTTLELQQYRTNISELKNRDYIPSILMILGCKDAEGKRLFKEADQLWLCELGADVTEPVVNAILRLSGIGVEAEEEILKNSSLDQDDPESE